MAVIVDDNLTENTSTSENLYKRPELGFYVYGLDRQGYTSEVQPAGHVVLSLLLEIRPLRLAHKNDARI